MKYGLEFLKILAILYQQNLQFNKKYFLYGVFPELIMDMCFTKI